MGIVAGWRVVDEVGFEDEAITSFYRVIERVPLSHDITPQQSFLPRTTQLGT